MFKQRDNNIIHPVIPKRKISGLFSENIFQEQAMAADPLVEHGISEFTAVDLVTCQSATAREGTEKLLSLIDEYGSSEVNIALIADQQETWYIEMYSGHQYAAVKLPTDKVSLQEVMSIIRNRYEGTPYSPDEAGALLNDVRWYMSRNSNTMKNGRNPETHEILDELKEIDPMEVKLDASVYGVIPQAPEPIQE